MSKEQREDSSLNILRSNSYKNKSGNIICTKLIPEYFILLFQRIKKITGNKIISKVVTRRPSFLHNKIFLSFTFFIIGKQREKSVSVQLI